MVVLAQLQAFSKDTEADTEQESAHKVTSHLCSKEGKYVVKLLFLHTLSLKKYCNLVHYNNGLVAREHGNTSRSPHNRIAFSDVQEMVAFIE